VAFWEQECGVRIGMIGLGRMGAGMTRRLLRDGHEVVVHDLSHDAMAAVDEDGAEPTASLAELVAALPAPRAVWVMIPAVVTVTTLDALGELLAPGDVIVDGGNSRYTDTVERAGRLAAKGIRLVDVGTSGGVWGLEQGYCLMVGGAEQDVARVEPALASLAPPGGYAHVGPIGAGHYAKMVHNGIEYGLMQAYAEGFELMAGGPYDFDVAQVAELWRRGSVIRSWLLDLAARALADDPKLERSSGYVEDSGEGRWTVETAIAHAVPVPAIASALFTRFASRTTEPFGNRLLAALRFQFGGHALHRQGEKEDL
jgi:6-phosphogluconate dehydrogenase